MRIYSYIVIGFLIAGSIFSSCNSDKQKKVPEYVIDQEKMIDLLVEVHIAEATLEKKQGHKANARDYASPYYKTIFDSFNTNPQNFDTNIAWYQQNMENFEDMYNQVMIKLTKLKDEHLEKTKKSSDKKKKKAKKAL